MTVPLVPWSRLMCALIMMGCILALLGLLRSGASSTSASKAGPHKGQKSSKRAKKNLDKCNMNDLIEEVAKRQRLDAEARAKAQAKAKVVSARPVWSRAHLSGGRCGAPCVVVHQRWQWQKAAGVCVAVAAVRVCRSAPAVGEGGGKRQG